MGMGKMVEWAFVAKSACQVACLLPKLTVSRGQTRHLVQVSYPYTTSLLANEAPSTRSPLHCRLSLSLSRLMCLNFAAETRVSTTVYADGNRLTVYSQPLIPEPGPFSALPSTIHVRLASFRCVVGQYSTSAIVLSSRLVCLVCLVLSRQPHTPPLRPQCSPPSLSPECCIPPRCIVPPKSRNFSLHVAAAA